MTNRLNLSGLNLSVSPPGHRGVHHRFPGGAIDMRDDDATSGLTNDPDWWAFWAGWLAAVSALREERDSEAGIRAAFERWKREDREPDEATRVDKSAPNSTKRASELNRGHVQMTGDPLDPLGLFEMAGPTLSENDPGGCDDSVPDPAPAYQRVLDQALHYKAEMWEARRELERLRAAVEQHRAVVTEAVTPGGINKLSQADEQLWRAGAEGAE